MAETESKTVVVHGRTRQSFMTLEINRQASNVKAHASAFPKVKGLVVILSHSFL